MRELSIAEVALVNGGTVVQAGCSETTTTKTSPDGTKTTTTTKQCSVKVG